jgi:hypothetical protein
MKGRSLIVALLASISLLLLWTSPCAARIERYGVVIGNNEGSKGDIELRYAEADALKVYDTLKDLGGFPPANMVLLRGESADTARRTLITINDRIRQSVASPDTQVIFVAYYSGHADESALHLGGSLFDLAEIDQLVRGSAAGVRLLIVDACRSGALTRVKGGKSAPSFAIKLDTRLAEQGVVFLTSNSANEDAQESDVLKGSFFTHYLVSGLMGAADADSDGKIDLEEAYQHASTNTIRATSGTFAGTQHPTFRYDLRGRGKLVLTALPANTANRATVELPAGKTYLLMEGGILGRVAAEVMAIDAARKISVKPGRYFVRGRGPDFLLEGDIQVSAGDALVLKDEQLGRVAYARLVRKGQDTGRVAHGPQAGYRMRTALSRGISLCHGFFAGYAIELANLSLMPRLGFCQSGFSNEILSASADQLDVGVRIAHAWDLPNVSVDLGLDAGVALLHQSFTTVGVAPDRNSGAGYIGASVGVTVDIPAGFYLLGEAAAQTYFFLQQPAEDDASATIGAAFAARPLIGLGKHW